MSRVRHAIARAIDPGCVRFAERMALMVVATQDGNWLITDGRMRKLEDVKIESAASPTILKGDDGTEVDATEFGATTEILTARIAPAGRVFHAG